MKMAHAPPGHHSVIGRPSTGGLNYAEYVVYRGEQVNFIMCAIYLIVNHCCDILFHTLFFLKGIALVIKCIVTSMISFFNFLKKY